MSLLLRSLITALPQSRSARPYQGAALLLLALSCTACSKLTVDTYCPDEAPCQEAIRARLEASGDGSRSNDNGRDPQGAANGEQSSNNTVQGSPTRDAGTASVPQTPAPTNPKPSTAGELPTESQCTQLASQFTLTGCGRNRLCHLNQVGCDLQAFCGGEVLQGHITEADELELRLPNGHICSGTATEDLFSVNCEEPASAGSDADDAACSLVARNNFRPSATCLELPKVQSLTMCGAAMLDCDWIQDSCQLQASCNDGQTQIEGQWLGETLSLQAGGTRCTGEFVDGEIQGSCLSDKGSQCPWSMTTDKPATLASCAVQWPTEGFALTGCERDASACHLLQRQCVWEIACGAEVYGGRFDAANGELAFTSNLAASCTGYVENNTLKGDCVWGNEFCSFSQAQPPALGEACSALPESLSLHYCGSTFDCETVQNNCHWQALCAQGTLRLHGRDGLPGEAHLAIGSRDHCSLLPGDDGWAGNCDFADQICDSPVVQLLATGSPTP